MRKLVLFDIDGTLVLTGGAGMRALARAFDEVAGIAGALEGVALAGRTDRAILRDVLASHAREDVLGNGGALALRARYVAYLRDEMLADAPGKRVLPGVRPLLDALSQRHDVVLALLTGNIEDGARIKLEYFDLWRYFRWGAFGDVDDRNSLLPVALARARDDGFAPRDGRDVIVVGDTPHDVACARSGGAMAIGVATGPYGTDALRECGADAVFTDLGDVERVLEVVLGD